MTPAAPALSPADRLARIIGLLCDAVAAEGVARGLAGPLVVLIWTRLRRLASRFAALAVQTKATPRPLRHRTASTSRPHALPRRFAWLLRWLPGTAAVAAQLRHLLAEPDMAALLQAAPATGRALRPLCHMLGLRLPAALRRPPRPAPIPAVQPEITPPAQSAAAPPAPAAESPSKRAFAPAPLHPILSRARASP